MDNNLLSALIWAAFALLTAIILFWPFIKPEDKS